MHDRPHWRRGENGRGARSRYVPEHAERADWRGSDDRPPPRMRERMADPHYLNDDYRPARHAGRRGYDERYLTAREREERDWADKAADEVKSWLGNERAERRRRMDREQYEQEHGHRRDHERRRDFSGFGPRTRHDEDDELRDAICEQLADDPALDASDILVRVIDNEAILDGVVESRQDAVRAYAIASDTPGVVHVRERLSVGRSRDDDVRRATIGMGYEERRRRHRH